MDSSTASFRKHEPVHFEYWLLLVDNILQIPCISQDLHGVQHWNVDVHSLDYFHKAPKLFMFHSFLCLRGNGSRCVSLMSLGEALPRFSSSFSGHGSASTSASASAFYSSSSSIGSVGPIFLDFALGSAIVFPDQVITALHFP
jgi:hypothetical protein